MLILLGSLFAFFGFAAGAPAIGFFGLFGIGIAVLKIVQDGKKNAVVRARAAEEDELRRLQLEQLRRDQAAAQRAEREVPPTSQ